MAFVTITLRNLDSKENADVIKILDTFMFQRDIKTGQRAIEEIIKEYDYMKNKCQLQFTEIENMKKENNVMYNVISEENDRLKNVVKNYKNFQKLLNEL